MRLLVIALALQFLLVGCDAGPAPGSVGFVDSADPLLEPPNMMAQPAEPPALNAEQARR